MSAGLVPPGGSKTELASLCFSAPRGCPHALAPGPMPHLHPRDVRCEGGAGSTLSRTQWVTLYPLNNPGSSPVAMPTSHLSSVYHLKSPWPCNVTYAQVTGTRMCASLGGHYRVPGGLDQARPFPAQDLSGSLSGQLLPPLRGSSYPRSRLTEGPSRLPVPGGSPLPPLPCTLWRQPPAQPGQTIPVGKTDHVRGTF